jgi:beta-phosphoglucomutase-like phosphatase (HAD superfamily)
LLGLENSFDFIVDSSGFSKPKPDPEIFERAILGLGTSAEECLVIEDSLNGILAAKAAGCIAAAIPTSFTKQERARSGADFVADNFEQLRVLIELVKAAETAGACRAAFSYYRHIASTEGLAQSRARA